MRADQTSGRETDIVAQLDYLDAVAASRPSNRLLEDIQTMRDRLHDELRRLGIEDVAAWRAEHKAPHPAAPPAPALSQESLRAARAALYDYKAETRRYLANAPGGGDPTPEDLCCDTHRDRWERFAKERRSLEQRLATIVTAIAEVEALITDEPAEAATH